MTTELTPAQLIFIKSKMLGRTNKRSSHDAGVSERTGSSWANDPEIIAEIAILKEDRKLALKDFAQSLKQPALATLNTIRADRTKSDTARINASKAILAAIAEMDMAEHREKLTELERLLKLDGI